MVEAAARQAADPHRLPMAVCQLRMNWSGDDNTAGIVDQLALAASQGALIGLFPELAVTGIHRQIAQEAQPHKVAAWLERIGRACREHRIAASVGAPTFTAEGTVRISQLFIDAGGNTVGTVHKRGLTAPEATFFVPGEARPTVDLLGVRWSAMICREIDDAEAMADVWTTDPPEIVLWPGALRPDPVLPRTDPPDHVQRAQALARRCRTMIVMVNWPNALNRPEEGQDAGCSVVIDASGNILMTLPRAESGLALFERGGRRYRWLEQPA